MHDPTRTIGMLGASATTRMPREPPTRPAIIHGTRIPHRDDVRSLILPKNGLLTMANRAPTPAMSAKLFGALSIPTSELTFSARVTSRGARNSRQVPMYANVYREMKPQATRCTPGGLGSSMASAADLYSKPGPLVGGRYGWAAGLPSPGGERSGIARSST